jgi:hypothetical protein
MCSNKKLSACFVFVSMTVFHSTPGCIDVFCVVSHPPRSRINLFPPLMHQPRIVSTQFGLTLHLNFCLLYSLSLFLSFPLFHLPLTPFNFINPPL